MNHEFAPIPDDTMKAARQAFHAILALETDLEGPPIRIIADAIQSAIGPCEVYLKDGETVRERMDRFHSEVLSLVELLAREKDKHARALHAEREKALEEAAVKTEGWPIDACDGQYQTSGNGRYWDAGTPYDQGRLDASSDIRAMKGKAAVMLRALAAENTSLVGWRKEAQDEIVKLERRMASLTAANERLQIECAALRIAITHPHGEIGVGTEVEKVNGYRWPGEVRSVFTTKSGAVRFVVECTVPEVAGALHIFNGEQLARQKAASVADHA